MLPHLVERTRCASGCGEIYLGEWHADPPGCCDSCDMCGNFVGHQGYCGPSFRELWGIRYEGGCGGCETGCSSCAHHDHVVEHHGHDAHWHDGESSYPAPTLAVPPTRSVSPSPAPPAHPVPTPAPEAGEQPSEGAEGSDLPMLDPLPEPAPSADPLPQNIPPMQTRHGSRVYQAQRGTGAAASPFARRRR
ncbi:MAG: hypothetical protein KDB14_01605 [Planctomycetales bacterium]|nr:hypothetical protein [Planctomycetales bacterium]